MTKSKLKEKIENSDDVKAKNALLKGIANTNIGKKAIYGIKDKFLGFSQVFIEQNDGVVCRNIMQAIKAAEQQNQPSPLKDFPDNYSIWEIGYISEDCKLIETMREVATIENLLEMYK